MSTTLSKNKTKKRKLYLNLKVFFYMEKIEIRNRVKSLKTIEDLSVLLTDIKKNVMKIKRYPITAKQLLLFSNDHVSPRRFRTFHIKKKSGGLREIKAPTYQFCFILKALEIALSSVFEADSAAMGFAPGKSVVNNANVHVNQNYVFNIDLKDFFPSIPQARIWGRLKVKPFNFPHEIANVIAGLSCAFDDNQQKNVLPQGSPVSPLLTNAICNRLDYKMKGVAKRFGLHYSRYADDMTFSSMHNVYQEGSDFRKEIFKIIGEEGFTINDKKTRLLKKGTRQEVTGLTVNDKANVSRKYIKELRWILNVWEKYGYAKAYALFYPRYKSEKGYIKKGEPVMENVVAGKLDYLRMVRGVSNPAYKKLKARFENLQQVIFVGNDEEKANAKKFMYVQPYSVQEFEEYFHTEISLMVTKNGKLVGKCIIADMDKTLAISHATQKVLCPNLKDLAVGEEVNNKKLNNCHVILCRAKGKNYWMISSMNHKRDKILSIQNLKINPDVLLDIWEEAGFAGAASILGLITDHLHTTGSPFDEDFIKGLNKRYPGLILDTLRKDKTKFAKENIITKKNESQIGLTLFDLFSEDMLKEIKTIPQDYKTDENDKIIRTLNLE